MLHQPELPSIRNGDTAQVKGEGDMIVITMRLWESTKRDSRYEYAEVLRGLAQMVERGDLPSDLGYQQVIRKRIRGKVASVTWKLINPNKTWR